MFKIDDNNIAYDTTYVKSFSTDAFYKATPSFYFGVNQEAGGVHAALKKCSVKDLMDNENHTWMILRTRMDIKRYAAWMEEYKVETWCQDGFHLYCPRGVKALDKDNKLLFEAHSLWVIMDTLRLRPERPSYISSRLPESNSEIYHFDPNFPKFPEESEYEEKPFPIHNISLSYYDYDYNRHVNNISYINWLVNTFPPEYLDEYEMSFIDTEWKKQCHFSDNLTALTIKKKDKEEYLTQIFKDNNELVFRATTEWRKKTQ